MLLTLASALVPSAGALNLDYARTAGGSEILANRAQLSDDGRYVLIGRLHDRLTGSVSEVGQSGDLAAVMSGDARYFVAMPPSSSVWFLIDRVAATRTTLPAFNSVYAISADGRFVLASSSGDDLVPPTSPGLFVYDVLNSTYDRIADASFAQAMSADAVFVLFASSDPGIDAVGTPGLFLRNRVAATTTRLTSEAAVGSISADGRFVAYATYRDIFTFSAISLLDRQLGTTTTVGPPTSLTQGGSPHLSADGRYLAGFANNHTAYRQDLVTGELERERVVNDGYSVAVSSSGDVAVSNGGVRLLVSVACGDSYVEGSEACDDGNLTANDGCSPTCELEACHSCGGRPTTCTTFADGITCTLNPCQTAGACSAGVCAGGTDICLDQLCPGGPDPCTVDDHVTLPDRAIVDLDGRAFEVLPTGVIAAAVNGGSFTFSNASRITLDDGSLLSAPGKDVNAGTIRLESSGPCSLDGKVLADGSTVKSVGIGGNGGAIAVDCTGIEVKAHAVLEAKGGGNANTARGDGGSVSFTSLGAAVSTEKGSKIDVRGGKGFTGGTVSWLSDATCTLGTRVLVDTPPAVTIDEGVRDISGGGEGKFGAICDAGISLISGARISIGTPLATGGRFELEASEGPISIAQGVRVVNNGDDGGSSFALTSGGACTLNGSLLAQDNTIEGVAASLVVDCLDVTLDTKFAFVAKSKGGTGGTVLMTADQCTLGGKIDVRAASAKVFEDGEALVEPGFGGSVELECTDGIDLANRASINVSGSGGDGMDSDSGAGSVFLDSDGPISLAGTIAANAKGQGGEIDAEGCVVTVAATGKLLSNGATGGTNNLIAHSDLVVNGAISAVNSKASGTPGTNSLRYRNNAIISHPEKIRPASSPIQNAALLPCP